MKQIAAVLLAAVLLLVPAGCSSEQAGEQGNAGGTYTRISQEKAAEMMQREDGHIIIDVRRQDEYDQGHIPGAVLLPNESIGQKRPGILTDSEQIILVYCRTGNRSKQAAQKLADLGYVNVYEFGGIQDWTGEIVAEKQ